METTNNKKICPDCHKNTIKGHNASRCRSCYNLYIIKTGIRKGVPGLKGEKHPMWKGGKPKCVDCKKSIWVGGKRCRKCADIFYRGENAHNWDNGATIRHGQIRETFEYKQWRIAILNRDGFSCVSCGQIGGKLTTHHIKSFSKYPELRLDINNGVTLCRECHQKTDNYGGFSKKHK